MIAPAGDHFAAYDDVGAACDTYSANTCNGDDYDTNPGLAGNQDDVLPTAFFLDETGVFQN